MKKLLTALVAMMMVITMSMTSLAGQWAQMNGLWYYLQDNGLPTTGLQQIDGKTYFFYDDGHMAANETIGAYYCDESGAITVSGASSTTLKTGIYKACGAYKAYYNGRFYSGENKITGKSKAFSITYVDANSIIMNNDTYEYSGDGVYTNWTRKGVPELGYSSIKLNSDGISFTYILSIAGDYIEENVIFIV